MSSFSRLPTTGAFIDKRNDPSAVRWTTEPRKTSARSTPRRPNERSYRSPAV